LLTSFGTEGLLFRLQFAGLDPGNVVNDNGGSHCYLANRLDICICSGLVAYSNVGRHPNHGIQWRRISWLVARNLPLRLCFAASLAFAVLPFALLALGDICKIEDLNISFESWSGTLFVPNQTYLTISPERNSVQQYDIQVRPSRRLDSQTKKVCLFFLLRGTS